ATSNCIMVRGGRRSGRGRGDGPEGSHPRPRPHSGLPGEDVGAQACRSAGVQERRSAGAQACTLARLHAQTFPPRWLSSYATGEATKIEEYVPIPMPTRSAKANPLIASPPKRNRTNTTSSVVRLVSVVRESVELIARLSTRSNRSVLKRFAYSRTRSKTTTVS